MVGQRRVGAGAHLGELAARDLTLLGEFDDEAQTRLVAERLEDAGETLLLVNHRSAPFFNISITLEVYILASPFVKGKEVWPYNEIIEMSESIQKS